MKKIIIAACAFVSFVGMAVTPKYMDTYSFTMSAKVPYLSDGVRTYKSQSMSGSLYVFYSSETNAPVDAYAEVVNKKTKVTHKIQMKEFLYNLTGKSTKTTPRSVVTVYMTGKDAVTVSETSESHEEITVVNFAGNGSLKYLATVGGCNACGVDPTTYCNRLYRASGYFTGIMDCECPDSESWSHTLEAGGCGALVEDNEYVRSHFASFWGTWSAKFKTRSESVTK